MSEALNPYGDGFASERIVNHIKYYLNLITENQAISIKKDFCLNVSKLCLNMLIFYNNLNRIDTTNRLYYHLVCMSGTVFMIDISHTEAYKMSRFYNIFKQFIQYYLYLLIILGGLYLYTHHAFILGLIIGVTGSAINTVIFESYLAKAKRPDTMHISTGNMWRYLVAIIACMIWYFNKSHVSIIGIIIGLMISYVVVIIRPLLKVSK